MERYFELKFVEDIISWVIGLMILILIIKAIIVSHRDNKKTKEK